MSALFLDPHGDDVALFAAFSLQRAEDPIVCVVFDSYMQPTRGIPGCDLRLRQYEAMGAYGELVNGVRLRFLSFHDDHTCDAEMIACDLRKFPNITAVYAPACEVAGHDQHNLVALAAALAFGANNVKNYLAYTRTQGKSRHREPPEATVYTCAREVLPQSAEEIQRKLRALACFESQMQPDPRLGTAEWFYGNDFREYLID